MPEEGGRTAIHLTPCTTKCILVGPRSWCEQWNSRRLERTSRKPHVRCRDQADIPDQGSQPGLSDSNVCPLDHHAMAHKQVILWLHKWILSPLTLPFLLMPVWSECAFVRCWPWVFNRTEWTDHNLSRWATKGNCIDDHYSKRILKHCVPPPPPLCLSLSFIFPPAADSGALYVTCLRRKRLI